MPVPLNPGLSRAVGWQFGWQLRPRIGRTRPDSLTSAPMPAPPDAAAAFLAAARTAFAALTAEHLSQQQRQAAQGALRRGAEARIIVDVGSGRIRAALVLPGDNNPIGILDVIAGTGERAAA